ncbi:MAG: hypothetical protein RLZZ241_831 [Bacteroidota bacterium]
MERLRKKSIALLKVLFSIVLLYFVFNRIDFQEVWNIIRVSNTFYLFLALVCFVYSKWIASLRLNRYFHEIQLPLTRASNLKLYLLGMFYNLFLPGGIGGDAYKGFILNRTYGTPIKQLVAVLLLDRISGLYFLFLYGCLMIMLLNPALVSNQLWIISLIMLISLPIYWWGHRKFFSTLIGVFWPASGYAAIVQFAQLGSAYFLLISLGVHESLHAYLLVFLVSSIVAVLPITLGGIGSRELVFLYGAQWLGLQETTSLGVSMLFFGITAFVSLWGVGYHFRKPKLNLNA